MTKKKMITAVLLLAAAAAALRAQNAADFTVRPAEDGTGVVITKYIGFDTELVIPGSIGGKPVRVIGDSAFENAELTKVTIPAGVTAIGSYAFKQNKLTAITIPSGVTSIGDQAFADNQLTELLIPEGVWNIG